MRLVLTNQIPSKSHRFRTVGHPSPRFSWIRLSYGPTEEERRLGWTEHLKDLPMIIGALAQISMPIHSHVYGLLSFPSEVEYEEILGDFRKQSLPLAVNGKPMPRNRRWLDWLRGYRKNLLIRVANLNSELVSRLYERYDDWRLTPYIFLISKRPIENWADTVGSLRYPRIVDEEFLEKNGNLLTNHFEHGIDFIGLDLDLESIKSLAISISKKLNAELETR